MKNPKTKSIQRVTKTSGRTCKKKGYYYNQCMKRQRCSNNVRRKIDQRNQPPAIQ